MATTRTKVPSIHQIPSNATPEVKRFAESVKEALEVRLGRRGDPRDRAITLRELIDSGLAKELLDNPFDPNELRGTGSIDFRAYENDNLDLDIPPLPTGFTATPAVNTILLQWNSSQMNNLAHTEIWRASTNDLDATIRQDVTEATIWIDAVDPGETFYYWIRHVSKTGVIGPLTASVTATTTLIVTGLLAAEAVTTAKIAIDAIQGAVIAAGAIVESKVGTDAITTAKIADDAVTNALIATDAVNQDSIVANAVTASEIASATITASEIASNAIIAAKIAAGAVETDKLAANAVTAAKITSNTITASQIASNTITANEIAGTTITAAQIYGGTITATQIASDTITATQIDGNTITASEIASGTLTSASGVFGAISAAEITTGTLNASRLNLNGSTLTVTSSGLHISSGGVDTTQIATSAVEVEKIGAAAIGKIGFAECTNVNVANSDHSWSYYTSQNNASWNIYSGDYMGDTATAQVILSIAPSEFTEDGDLLVESLSQIYATLPTSGNAPETGHVIQVIKSANSDYSSPTYYYYASTMNSGIAGHQLAPIVNSFVLVKGVFDPTQYWKFSMWTHFLNWSGTFGISKAFIKIHRLNKGTDF